MYFYFWFKSFIIGLRICGILITLRRQILAIDLFPPFELGLIKKYVLKLLKIDYMKKKKSKLLFRRNPNYCSFVIKCDIIFIGYAMNSIFSAKLCSSIHILSDFLKVSDRINNTEWHVFKFIFEKNLYRYHMAFHKEIIHCLQRSDTSQYHSLASRSMAFR